MWCLLIPVAVHSNFHLEININYAFRFVTPIKIREINVNTGNYAIKKRRGSNKSIDEDLISLLSIGKKIVVNFVVIVFNHKLF